MYKAAAARTLLRRPALPTLPPRVAVAVEILTVAGYLAAFAVALWRMAALRMFWFDELFTLHLARQSPVEMWKSLAGGADNNPPFGYLLTAACVAVFGESEPVLRLPAIAGGVLAGLCLYLFVRCRRGTAEALLATAAIAPTAPIWIYFLEARPYGLIIGFTGLALLCWQRGWKLAFAAALVLGMASHYYFVVPVIGLGVAELVRTVACRKIDRKTLAGFAAAGLMLAALYPLWGYGPKTYAPGFWAKVKLTRAAVEDSFNGMYEKALTIPVALALAAGIVAGRRVGRDSLSPASAERGRGEGVGLPQSGRVTLGDSQPGPSLPHPSPTTKPGGEGYPLWEAVALAALAAGPAIGVAVGAKLVGAYYYRYTLPAAVGLAGAFAFLVGRAGGSAKWGCFVAAVGFAVTGPAGVWRDGPGHFRNEARDLRATADYLAEKAAGGTVVVEDPFTFARVWHYCGDRSFAPAFVADPAAALTHTKADTVDRGALALARMSPAPVVGFADVAARLAVGQPVYYFGSGGWHQAELEALGVKFESVGWRPAGTLFRLRLQGKP